MDWVTIISAIMPVVVELIKLCVEQDGETAVYRRLRRPGLREAWALRRQLAARGWKGQALQQYVQQAMSALESASDQDLRDLIADAQAGADVTV